MIAILRDTFLWAKTSCVVYTELHNTCQIKSILSTEWKISKLKMCVLPHAHGTELHSNFFFYYYTGITSRSIDLKMTDTNVSERLESLITEKCCTTSSPTTASPACTEADRLWQNWATVPQCKAFALLLVQHAKNSAPSPHIYYTCWGQTNKIRFFKKIFAFVTVSCMREWTNLSKINGSSRMSLGMQRNFSRRNFLAEREKMPKLSAAPPLSALFSLLI